MNKKLLSKIPTREASEESINFAKENEEEKYLISAEIIKVSEKKILLLYFYNQGQLKEGNTKAAFRTFLSTDNYITQDLSVTTIKWRTACIRNLIGGWYGWTNQCEVIDRKTSTTIKEYLKVNKDPLDAIEVLQDNIMSRRLEEKHRSTKERIDNQMKLVPTLPRGFDEWIDKTALYKSRYIFYKYKQRKNLDGYCTNCKSDVVVESPRHNLEGICPKCKSPITYKATGKSRNIIDRGQASLIQNIDGNIIVRYFSTYKSYQGDYKKPEVSFWELSRDFYDSKGKVKSYEYMDFKQSGETRWCDGEGRFGFHEAILYEKNLDEVLKGTPWEYSAIKLFATHKKGFGFQAFNYLEQYMKHPLIEYLVKLKLYKLTNQVIYRDVYPRDNINLEETRLENILNINKAQFNIAQRINAGKRELDIIRKAGKANLHLTDEQILYVAENLNMDKVIRMAEYTTVHKIIKYITTQGRNPSNTFNDWYDYIRDCKVLEYDLKKEFVLFPRDLREAHDNTYKLIKDNKNELFSKAIEEMSKSLGNKFNWKYRNYAIIVPKTADEITKEGQSLHHCVGNYIERIAKGETIVLFLRDKENLEEPYYTIEVDPVSKIVQQCRGKNNSSMSQEIKEIIKVYERDKLEPLAYKEAA